MKPVWEKEYKGKKSSNKKKEGYSSGGFLNSYLKRKNNLWNKQSNLLTKLAFL
jgi:hypothetical protein